MKVSTQHIFLPSPPTVANAANIILLCAQPLEMMRRSSLKLSRNAGLPLRTKIWRDFRESRMKNFKAIPKARFASREYHIQVAQERKTTSAYVRRRCIYNFLLNPLVSSQF
jgi:hypothetical protein